MAGRLMTSKVPIISKDATVSDVEKLLLKKTDEFETINYIYLTDQYQRLKGVISIKELFRSPKEAKVSRLIIKDIASVRTHTDQEKVALLALKHNLKAVPVVDKDDRLLGVVPSDTILKILNTENIEDALHMVGAGKLENPAVSIIKAPALLHFKKRLPWLVLGLIGGIIAAFIVGFFERSLEEQIALAAFIPAIVYMADAVGAQVQTIFIRSLALQKSLDLKKYLWREVRVNIFLSLVLGGLIFLFSFLWLASLPLSFVLGFSVFLTVLSAMVIALGLPLFLQKIRFDPAVASGPFATVLRDIISLLIYFGIAAWLL